MGGDIGLAPTSGWFQSLVNICCLSERAGISQAIINTQVCRKEKKKRRTSGCTQKRPVQLLSRVSLCNTRDCSMPSFPVLHHLLEFAQIHVHWDDGDAIQLSLCCSLLLLPCLSQHQGLFQWISFSHQVAKVLELQLQHKSFQWIFKVDFL